MASTSFSASLLNRTSSHDVFLSFRGEDTRNSFTDHLFAALVRAGLRTFRDNDNIDRGRELKPEIERAIVESRASIVVLSEKYANSRWCLDELLLILEQRRTVNHFVLPVFYHVNPSDVRNQRQSFAITIDEGVEGSKWTEYNVNRWKAALTQVADLTGMVLSGSETDFIAKIVHTIDFELDMKLVSTPAHLIGMNTRATAINYWLDRGESGGQVVAICGMGGIGKTTLAQFIYNSNKKRFENSSFLEEIGKHSKEPGGMLRLQKQLLLDILGGKNNTISHVSSSEYTSKIEDALQRKKVLIVLDDIDEHDELGVLLGTKVFHPQSKIIITTRLLDIHSWFGSTSRRCWVHKLQSLKAYESLELLNFHAFGSKIPMEGFKELAVQLARYCGGNALALKVLGSSLFVDSQEPWKINNMIEVWRSTLNSLNSLKGGLDDRIQGILQKSFDSLPHASNKELFLYIVFLFVGEYEDFVVTVLEHDLHAKAGIMTLINRCLVTVSSSKKLMMHELLQEMGRNIVLKESKDPAERRIVSQNKESYRLLEKGEGSKTIEALALDMLTLERTLPSLQPLALNASSLAKMNKLKLLKLKYVELTGSYKNFPELIWLYWQGCNIKTILSGLLMSSSLVAVDMSHGDLRKFEPPMVLNSLKILNLKESKRLVSIRNLSRLPNLETLILWNCKRLTHVCETIGGLKSLALLDFTGCKNLWKVSSIKKYVNVNQLKCTGGGFRQQPWFPLPGSLKFLFLNNCNLENNNYVPTVDSGRPLLYMNLGNNLFEVLPNTINLKMLRVLELTGCQNLKFLQCLPSKLEELYICWCSSLHKITFESATFRLRKFAYRGCNNLSEVQGLFKLVPIAMLDEADLRHMKWIKAYQYHRVYLVGDEITKGRIWPIQVLYEYGLMSTYLPGIEVQSMTTPDYTSSSPFLSFRVPSCPKKRIIQGLHVTASYRSDKNVDVQVLFTKISNTTKGITWMYNPVVYCQPKVGEDVLWLSYWPIGNILETGDEVGVSIIVGSVMMVSWCGASLVYIDDGEGEGELKSCQKQEEVIGGDLSEFELSTGEYYLCRRDFFKSTIPDWSKILFGNTNHTIDFNVYTELSRGWRKSRQTQHLNAKFMEVDVFRSNYISSMRTVMKVDISNETKRLKVLKALYALNDIYSIQIDTQKGLLIIDGWVDAYKACKRVRKIMHMHVEIVSVGPHGNHTENR